MAEGSDLVLFRVEPEQAPTEPSRWKVYILTKDLEFSGWTTSRVVTLVLETALLEGRKRKRWPIVLETDEKTARINRVRISDDRDCKGVLDSLQGKWVMPLTPTAFADSQPPKWGFFFAEGQDCKEALGTSLDLYEVVERAWRDETYIMLRLDEQGYVVGVENTPEVLAVRTAGSNVE
jgi:hypothetical protein